jgi:hypothetical protein
MQEAPTQQTQNPQGEPEDAGSLEAAAAAFAALNQSEEAEPDPESAEESSEEAEEADPEDEDEAGELVEVDIDGVKVSLPADQADKLQKGYLRQSDYSRKMNEASEKEKSYSDRLQVVEQLSQGVEKLAEAKAEVVSIEAEIKRYERIDWQKLRAENPAEYAALAADLQSLRLNKGAAQEKIQGIEREVSKERQKLLVSQREEMVKTLQKNLKGWGDELGTQITRYALEKGWSAEQLQTLTDANVVIALDKARRFDELQAKKESLKTKVKDAPPVAKPGAPRKPDAGHDAMVRLRKSGSLADAEAAFMARMK